MRQKYEAKMQVPEGITCEIKDNSMVCKKGGEETSRRISLLKTEIKVEGNQIKFSCKKANKKNIAYIKAHMAHIRNMFKGLQHNFEYSLEICNVHFPMTVKVDGNKVVIGNFLGEKVNRKANILPNVKVEVKGQEITVTSTNKEAAGQTAANIEKASKVPKKDRRVFQDGIFITNKPGRNE